MTGDQIYPAGTVRAVIGSDLVTTATAAALNARLAPLPPFEPVLDTAQAALFTAVCARLVPQPDRDTPVDVAAIVHCSIATGPGDGWRYAGLPTDADALVTGLALIDEVASVTDGRSFIDLDDERRDAVLRAVQEGATSTTPFDSARWFEEILAAVVEAYYAHPLAQEEIGYLGMADAKGWPEVGLGAREAFEPVASAVA